MRSLRIPNRFFRLLSLAFIAGLVLLVYKEWNTAFVKSPPAKLESPSKWRCQISDQNPYDLSIMEFFDHVNPVDCEQVQPWYTFIDPEGLLQLNESEPLAPGVECYYHEFDKVSGAEKTFGYRGKKPMYPGQKYALLSDFVEVACTKADTDHPVYLNIHAHPRDRDRQFKKVDGEHLSVLVMGIDSTSLSMLQRSMPITYNYLTHELNVYEMKGYNKIADSTFPNMVPFLTGKRVYSQQEDMPDEFEEDYQNTYHDHWPLIWKYFNQSDYVTTMIEERSINGIFHYLQKGFIDKPVEYYYRPYYYSMDTFSHRILDNSSEFCFGNDPKIVLELDHLLRHLRKHRDTLYFTFWYHTELSHDHPNDLEGGDIFMAKFLERTNKENLLNNTILVFVSDHGHRFGSIRKTGAGLLEERKPMLLIHLPEWFKKKHPHIDANLLLNQKRLLSQFDMYQTFFDILNANYSGSQMPKENRGHSLLYPIAEYRTCKEAGIPDQYCACYDLQPQPLEFDSEESVRAAQLSVAYINQLLKPCLNVCVELTPHKLQRAELVKFHDGGQERSRIRLWLKVKPSGQWYETFVNYDVATDKMTLHGDVNVLGWYGSDSDCISDVVLKKFCFCKSKMETDEGDTTTEKQFA